MKTLTVGVPDDLDEAIARIDDLEERVVNFLRHQADLEAWRRRRCDSEVRALGEEAIRRGRELKETLPRDERVRRFRASRQVIENEQK